MVKLEFVDSKTDSTFTGYGGDHYPNGNLKSLSYFKNGEPIDTLFYYYENGKVKEKGLIKNGVENGWWSYYREDGTLKEKIEWIPKSYDTIYKNQKLYFNQNGELKLNPSTYFKIEIPDTIQLGKNIAFVKNYVSKFNDVDERFLSVIIENQYSETNIKKDTFSDGSLNPYFGVYGYKLGKQVVNGQIEEKILIKKEINKDSSSLTIIDDYKYFEKEVFVIDNAEISEKNKKIIKDYFESKKNN